MELEQRNHQESLKEIKKNDRKLKELASQADEDRQNQVRLQDQVEKLQTKVKFYKRQADETEDYMRGASVAPSRCGSMRR